MTHNEFLRAAREVAGFDQKTAALALGWGSAQFLSNIERGLADLPPQKIKKISKLYRIDPEDLVHQMTEDYQSKLWRYL